MKTHFHRCLENVTAAGDEISATLTLPPEFPAFRGHFPNNPVLPAVCLVQAGVILAQFHSREKTRLVAIKRAKFLQPVVPDEVLTITCTQAAGDAKIVVKRAADAQEIARFNLELERRDA